MMMDIDGPRGPVARWLSRRRRVDHRPTKQGPMWLLPGWFHEHEVFLLAWSILIGAGYLFGAPRSGALANQLSPVVIVIWSWAMTLSGVIGLIGCFGFRKRMDIAFGLERGALALQAGGLMLFAVSIVSNAGATGLTVAGICMAWALANLTRAWRISVGLKAAHDAGNAEHAP